MLLEIARRGVLGGHHGIDVEAEPPVLFALAGLQQPGALFEAWLAAWKRDVPGLWPVITAGLRLSDAKRALTILPTAVERAVGHADFLGEVLWAFATDERYAAADIAGALRELPPEARERSRRALEALGAEEAELAEWLPARVVPAWCTRPGLRIIRPPRFAEMAAC